MFVGKLSKIPYFDHHFLGELQKNLLPAQSPETPHAPTPTPTKALGGPGADSAGGKSCGATWAKVGSKKRVIPLFVGFQPSKVVVVQDFATIHSINDPFFTWISINNNNNYSNNNCNVDITYISIYIYINIRWMEEIRITS